MKNNFYSKFVLILAAYSGLVLYQFIMVFLFFGIKGFNFFDILLNIALQLFVIFINYKWSLGGEKNPRFKLNNLLKILLVFILYHPLFYFSNYYIVNLFYPNEYLISEFDLKGFYFTHSEYFLHYLLFSIGYWYYKKTLFVQKLSNKRDLLNKDLLAYNLRLELEKEQLTNQKIEADYNYLRSQINPHFLYNTLGFIYTKVAMQDPEVGSCVEMLINLMRYSLHKGDAQGRVPLQSEIENVDSYIGLQKIRFGSKLHLVYHKNVPEACTLKTIPHLLLTVVENAFKHGNNSDPEKPLQITIDVKENLLNFTVINLINQVQVELPSTKTGLLNMENRLAMVYKEQQQFSYTIKDNLFLVSLKINLADELATSSDSNNQEAAESNLSNADIRSTVLNKAALL